MLFNQPPQQNQPQQQQQAQKPPMKFPQPRGLPGPEKVFPKGNSPTMTPYNNSNNISTLLRVLLGNTTQSGAKGY